METTTKTRIYSLDLLRGLVMIIMALDHVRDYLHYDAYLHDPLDVSTTTIPLYFTRWITHFCAPVFVFLAGASIYLQSQRKTVDALSIFLLKRGLWLIFIEISIVSLGWTFDLTFGNLILQVIWAIGICMVIMAALIRLRYRLVLTLGIFIVVFHNVLDFFRPENPGFLLNLLHDGNFVFYPLFPNHSLVMVYPFVPWLGLMILGYGTGRLYASDYDPARRRKLLVQLGWSGIAVFVLLRAINLYGDPLPWSPQATAAGTLMSFLNVQKYPPSLLYTCVTISPALLLLTLFERWHGKAVQAISVYGRVPFLYYIVHIYAIHLITTIAFFMRGHHLSESNSAPNFPFNFVVIGEGFSLQMVYVIWILLVLALYPLCKWFSDYKKRHQDLAWLSYF